LILLHAARRRRFAFYETVRQASGINVVDRDEQLQRAARLETDGIADRATIAASPSTRSSSR
jgi:hypothetical protein